MDVYPDMFVLFLGGDDIGRSTCAESVGKMFRSQSPNVCVCVLI